jgi:hypothetical protein
MFPLQQFLTLLIVTTPAIIIFDGPMIHGLVIAGAALSLAIVALRIRPGEAEFLSSVIRLPAVFALIPAFSILFQVLPLKTVGLANPIWDSAAAAVGRHLGGSISIDPGATLVSLARYLSVAAIALVAAAVAVDRYRGKWVLFSLVAATTLIAAMVLANCSGYFTFLNNGAGGATVNAATDCAGLGVVLATAAALQTIERGRTNGKDQSPTRLVLTFVACLVAVTVCSLAVIVDAPNQTDFAITCGVATLVVAIVIRLFRLGPWGYSAIVAVVLVVAVAVVALQPRKPTVDLTLMFATRAPAPLIAVTQRILAETRWTGTGAGTFAAALPIYRDIDELTTGPVAPTAAAAIAVEMGRPFLWAMLLAAIALVVTLLRGSMRRGRDSFYSAAGASCVVTFALLGFGSAGLFSTPVLIIAAATVGVAIAQSKSRSPLIMTSKSNS